ncbi:hypothetical protein F4825DRAFT_372935 [Nemania diffusa]|nr:hypothetical protein F4825DRAFT_372935 [Nemania diffusa]
MTLPLHQTTHLKGRSHDRLYRRTLGLPSSPRQQRLSQRENSPATHLSSIKGSSSPRLDDMRTILIIIFTSSQANIASLYTYPHPSFHQLFQLPNTNMKVATVLSALVATVSAGCFTGGDIFQDKNLANYHAQRACAGYDGIAGAFQGYFNPG